jgi:hypothetical protein
MGKNVNSTATLTLIDLDLVRVKSRCHYNLAARSRLDGNGTVLVDD